MDGLMGYSTTISFVKAIGIMLMVLAHTLPSESIVWRVIYTFHMPLFFIMSGYCFKEKYLDDAKGFVGRKIIGIYVPFVLFSLVFLSLHNVFCRLYIYDSTWLYCRKDYLWQTSRIVTRMSHNEGLLGTFWFLKELFWGNLVFYAELRIWKRKIIPAVIGLFSFAEVLCLTHLRIPYFNVTYNSVFAALFIAIGYWWRQANWQLNKLVLWIGGPALIALELLLIHKPEFMGLSPTQLPVFILPALAGTMMIYDLSRIIIAFAPRFISRLLEFIGEHTMSIMALHFLSFKIVSFGLIKAFHLPIVRLADFPVIFDYANIVVSLLYTIVGVFVPLSMVGIWLRGKRMIVCVKSKVYDRRR